MRIPYNWLNDWICPLAAPDELAERLTMAGLEVEAVEGEGEEAVLVAKTTPNRGDWLSIRGVAREVAAIYDATMTTPDLSSPEEADWRTEDLAQVAIEDAELCPRYSARIIDGVKVAESPDWLKSRLLSAGIRPINNVVDATNLVLVELGQPLHAFDFDRLAGGRIVVRPGRDGETMTTIDGGERSLSERDLVIGDARRPVALAGVMGGSETEVGMGTQRILLESAHFAPSAVRRTAAGQGMSTEASYRFERWVDPAGTVEALNRVSRLIVELTGGEVGKGAIDVQPSPIQPIEVLFRPQRANALLGIRVDTEEMVQLLRRLGFSVDGDGQLRVTIPTFRNDILREADVIEEVARLYGYDRIPSALRPATGEIIGQSDELEAAGIARDTLRRCGLAEVVTFGLTRPQEETEATESERPGLQLPFHFGQGKRSGSTPLVPSGAEGGMIEGLVTLDNPLTEEFSVLRRSLLPSLLGVAARNIERGLKDVNVFEVGKRYEQSADGSCSEKWLAGVLITGARGTGGLGSTGADFYQAKGIVEAVLSEFGIPQASAQRGEGPFYEAGRAGEMVSEGRALAHWGQVATRLLERHDISQAVFYAEIDLERLESARKSGGKHRIAGRVEYQPVPRHPAARRDLAVEIPEQMAFAELEGLVRGSSDELLVEVNVFDVYRGRQIPAGQKSLAIRLDFQAPDRTLTDDEVAERVERIISALEGQVGVSVRRVGKE